MLILADTSVWVNHLRKHNSLLASLLEESSILMHPCVVGELALGSLKQRTVILGYLDTLPEAEVAAPDEVRHLIESKNLWGHGMGWIDAQLLSATLLTQNCSLWTLDTALRACASKASAKLYHGVV